MQEIIDRLDKIQESIAMPKKEYLPVDQAASFLGLSKQQLDLWRIKGGGPAFHKVGRKVLYSVGDLRAFMQECRHSPLS